jgi:8-oxo-dGTP pyrophosphatase MutT (NUDIX family)
VPAVALTVLRLRGTDELVFQRRDHNTRAYPGLLSFFGGTVEPGESPRAAALREVNEETSLALESAGGLRPLGTVGMSLTDVGHAAVHLFEAVIESADFAVYEGVRAEVYSKQEALLRSDVASHSVELMHTLVR